MGTTGHRRESLDAPSEHARQPHTGAEHLRLNASVSGALRGTEGSNPSPSSGESGANRNWPAGMSDADTRDIVAFLENLTGELPANFATASVLPMGAVVPAK